MQYPVRKFLAYFLTLVFVFTCVSGNTPASATESLSSSSAIEEADIPINNTGGAIKEADIAMDSTDNAIGAAETPETILSEGAVEEAAPDSEQGLLPQDISE